MKADLVGVVEAAYSVTATDETWLSGVLEGVAALDQGGLGCYAHFVDASDPSHMVIGAPQTSALRAPLDVLAANQAMSPEDVRVFYGTKSVDTASHLVGPEHWTAHNSYRSFFSPAGAEDVVGIVAVDARRIGAVIAIPLPRLTRLSARATVRYERLAAHVATGLRLRRSLAAGASPTDDAEAVLSADGRIEHAHGAAKSGAARSGLQRMAQQLDRARASLRREDPDAALEIWTALACGRWTLLEHFDRDGRRYLVARQNEPAVAHPLSLTPRERQVLAYVALGHSNKLIGYELGLSPSTVSEVISAGVAKLGLSSRAEVAHVFQHIVAAAAAGAKSPS